GKAENKTVDGLRCDTWADMPGDKIERCRSKLACPAHTLEPLRPIKPDFSLVCGPERRAIFRSMHGNKLRCAGALLRLPVALCAAVLRARFERRGESRSFALEYGSS